MIKFIIGMVFGGFVGAMWMALCQFADEEDEIDKALREPTEERCKFCGGKLSEPMVDINGKKYRHCYGCHFDYEVE